MQATVVEDRAMGQMVQIHIRNDPFPTYVDHDQLVVKGARMPKKQGGARELRARAKNLEIPDWELLDRDALAEAVAEAENEEAEADEESPTDPIAAARAAISDDEDAEEEEEDMPTKQPSRRKATRTKKAPTKKVAKQRTRKSAPASKRTGKKAPASKKTAKKRAPRQPTEYEGPNPYRPGTNLYHLAEAVMKGGKRSALVKQLKKKLKFNPRSKTKREFDTDVEIDRRIKVVYYILKKDYGFSGKHEGRGPDAYIKATPPR